MNDSGTILYRRFLAGDVKALEELVRIYSDALVRFAFSYVHDFQTAEDIMADTFASLMIKRKNFREIAQFKTYLYKIARNKAIDYLRAQKRFLPITERSAHSPSAEEDLLRREREEQLYAHIQDLAPQYAEVLQLHYFEEFSVKEMCKILHKSTKQVYNLLSRAKLTLKENFCKEGISHEDL